MPPPPLVAGRAPEPAGPAGAAGAAGGPAAALSLANLFGGDLSRLPQLAGLANFPSIPPVSWLNLGRHGLLLQGMAWTPLAFIIHAMPARSTACGHISSGLR